MGISIVVHLLCWADATTYIIYYIYIYNIIYILIYTLIYWLFAAEWKNANHVPCPPPHTQQTLGISRCPGQPPELGPPGLSWPDLTPYLSSLHSPTCLLTTVRDAIFIRPFTDFHFALLYSVTSSDWTPLALASVHLVKSSSQFKIETFTAPLWPGPELFGTLCIPPTKTKNFLAIQGYPRG